jgi:hypothetical protein
MTLRNLTITFEEGRIMTWRFPDFSALLMALSASFYITNRVSIALNVRSDMRRSISRAVGI